MMLFSCIFSNNLQVIKFSFNTVLTHLKPYTINVHKDDDDDNGDVGVKECNPITKNGLTLTHIAELNPGDYWQEEWRFCAPVCSTQKKLVLAFQSQLIQSSSWTRKREHITPVLKVSFCIDLKTLLLLCL